jgi:hypothetical protein
MNTFGRIVSVVHPITGEAVHLTPPYMVRPGLIPSAHQQEVDEFYERLSTALIALYALGIEPRELVAPAPKGWRRWDPRDPEPTKTEGIG